MSSNQDRAGGFKDAMVDHYLSEAKEEQAKADKVKESLPNNYPDTKTYRKKET